MSDHADVDDGPLPDLPSGTTGLVIKIMIRTLEKAGHGKEADWIKQLPERASSLAARLIRLMEGKATGQPITQADVKRLETELIAEPEQTSQLLGAAISSAVEAALNSPRDSLHTYELILNMACDVMTAAHTSLALHGFVHAGNCISYWHIKGPNPRFVRLSDHLYSADLDVYLFWNIEPTPETLDVFNAAISDSDQRCLERSVYERSGNDLIGLVKGVRQRRVRINRLNPDREDLKAHEPPDVFGRDNRSSEFDLPMDIDYAIPEGAPDLIAMFGSLIEAVEVQGRHSRLLRNTLEAVNETQSKIPKT